MLIKVALSSVVHGRSLSILSWLEVIFALSSSRMSFYANVWVTPSPILRVCLPVFCNSCACVLASSSFSDDFNALSFSTAASLLYWLRVWNKLLRFSLGSNKHAHKMKMGMKVVAYIKAPMPQAEFGFPCKNTANPYTDGAGKYPNRL